MTDSYKISIEKNIELTPMPAIIWNKDLTINFINTKALNLFKVENGDKIKNNFFEFSPKFQPDTKESIVKYKEKLEIAFNNSYEEFLWLHIDLNNNKLFSRITLQRVDFNNDENIVVAYIENLNFNVMNYYESTTIEEYFTDNLSVNTFAKSVFDMQGVSTFYWDLRTNKIKFYANGAIDLRFGKDAVAFPDFMYENNLIFKEDEEFFGDKIESAKTGLKGNFDMKFNSSDGHPEYYRINYNVVKDKNSRPISVVGFATDIDAEKKFEIKSQTDLLTGCYNKITAETMTADYISRQSTKDAVIYIIDIDNFKAVNDNLGHHFGDIVLREIASKLKSCFRHDDIVGRIGGDEFLVLAKNLKDEKIITEKAKNVLEAFKEEYKGENNSYKVSGSVGIAKFPQDGKFFEDLYKAADKALYQSKLNGKDCYTLYTDELVDGTMKNRTILENAGRLADTYFDSEIISDIFELMFESKDIKSSINMALKRIGMEYNADRCYIFESFNSGKTYDNTFEWCKEGIKPEIEGLKGLTAEVLADFFVNADKDGIVYTNDLKELKADGAFKLMDDQDIKSFLHAQINEKNAVRLFLGLDDCTAPRVWTPKEINSLKYLAKIISIFLKK